MDLPPSYRLSGIYKITNTVNGKFYIGSAVNFKSRWANHKSAFRHNKHDNPIFERAWHKYGETAFMFEILLYCDIKDLLFYEQRFLDVYFDRCKKCYNICPIAGSCLGIKQSEAAKLKKKRFGENNHFYGKQHTSKTKKDISNRAKGRFSGETSACAKLTNIQAQEIRVLYASGLPIKDILIINNYNVSETVIVGILNNKHYIDNVYDKLNTFKQHKNNNTLTKERKQLANIGSNNPAATLTWELVNNMRKDYLTLQYSQRDIARKYNQSFKNTSRVLNNERWININYIVPKNINSLKYNKYKKDTICQIT